MKLRMWTYDLAREQCPTLDHLRQFFDVTRLGGYHAIGLYLEHRFAFPSTPWAHGQGAVTPEMIASLLAEYPDLQIIPFVNLLGHMEGFLYTEPGHRLAAERYTGMQADPTNPALVRLAEAIIDDTLAIFPGEIIHLGGDETMQLGLGPGSSRVVDEYERILGVDGKARLYADHFAPLCRHVVDAGRRPALWADMFADHPSALDFIPKNTILFDWQYFKDPTDTSRSLRAKGFDVVYCPTLHTYNACWLHLPQSETNIREHAQAAAVDNAYGVCVTTWECALFGNYEALLPAIRGAGRILQEFDKEYAPVDQRIESPVFEPTEQWPALPGIEDANVPWRLLGSIVGKFLKSQAPTLSATLPGDGYQFIASFPNRSEELATLPSDQGRAVISQIALLANLDPLKSNELRQGTVQGSYKGEPFKIQVDSTPTDSGVELALTTVPRANGIHYQREREAPVLLRAYLEEGERHEYFARLMGTELQEAGGIFTFTGIRSSMKCRMLLYSNPFLFWLHHREELVGEVGDKALETLEHAISVAPDAGYRGIAEFVRLSIEFVRHAEDSHRLYSAGLPGQAAAALIPCRQVFENLIRIAKGTNLRIGGSEADIARCVAAREHIEKVIRRVKEYGDGALGYMPSFETLTHPKFIPHDQGNWWLINRWANE